jgi:hypothetical protein
MKNSMKKIILSRLLSVALILGVSTSAYAFPDDFQNQQKDQNRGTSLDRLEGTEKPAAALPQGKYEGNRPAEGGAKVEGNLESHKITPAERKEQAQTALNEARNGLVDSKAPAAIREGVQRAPGTKSMYVFEGNPKYLSSEAKAAILKESKVNPTQLDSKRVISNANTSMETRVAKMLKGDQAGTVRVTMRVGADGQVTYKLTNANLSPTAAAPQRGMAGASRSGTNAPPSFVNPKNIGLTAQNMRTASNVVAPITKQLNNADRILTPRVDFKNNGAKAPVMANNSQIRQASTYLKQALSAATTVKNQTNIPKAVATQLNTLIQRATTGLSQPNQTMSSLQSVRSDLVSIRNMLLDINTRR